jgi:hypothetical protein
MVMEDLKIQIMRYIMENGFKINDKVSDNRYIKMEIHMKDSGKII